MKRSGVDAVSLPLQFKSFSIIFFYQQGRARFVRWQEQADEEEEKRVVERAVMKIKKMDEFLKARGFWHLIYISPTRKQLLHSDTKNELVQKMLGKYNLNVTYLLDRLHSLELPTNVKETLFHDRIHLEKEGHKLWGKFIGDDLVKLINP